MEGQKITSEEMESLLRPVLTEEMAERDPDLGELKRPEPVMRIERI